MSRLRTHNRRSQRRADWLARSAALERATADMYPYQRVFYYAIVGGRCAPRFGFESNPTPGPSWVRRMFDAPAYSVAAFIAPVVPPHLWPAYWIDGDPALPMGGILAPESFADQS